MTHGGMPSSYASQDIVLTLGGLAIDLYFRFTDLGIDRGTLLYVYTYRSI